MLKNGILENQIMNSPLENSSVFSSGKSKIKKSMIATLVLTPLVDAFAIIVIYLLVNTTATQNDMNLDGDLQLPIASQTHTIDSGVVVKIKNNQYFIDGKRISENNLVRSLESHLAELGKKDKSFKGQLIVQADKKSYFKILSPIMTAGSSAGFNKIKFAVIHEDM